MHEDADCVLSGRGGVVRYGKQNQVAGVGRRLGSDSNQPMRRPRRSEQFVRFGSSPVVAKKGAEEKMGEKRRKVLRGVVVVVKNGSGVEWFCCQGDAGRKGCRRARAQRHGIWFAPPATR